MAAKTFRLIVKKIPRQDEIVYKKPDFPVFPELYLDLLENKIKLRKNPPKPVFVRPPPEPAKGSDKKRSSSEKGDKKGSGAASNASDDYTLDDLEKAYENNDADDLISEHSSHHGSHRGSRKASDKSSNGSHHGGHGHHDHGDDHDDSDKHHHSEQDKTSGGAAHVPAEPEVDAETREFNEKSDYLFKFMVLRKKYKGVDIPEFTEHSDLITMKRTYEQVIRRVSLDSAVSKYRQYLSMGFMVMEYISTNVIGLDASGLARSQTNEAMLSNYDELLIELGEKNYSYGPSRFPVEVRLCFWVMFYSGMFLVQKKLFSGLDFGAMGARPAQSPMQPTQQQQQQQQQPRPTMRGPTITPADVEKLARGGKDVDD